jgi:hypothetical protein
MSNRQNGPVEQLDIFPFEVLERGLSGDEALSQLGIRNGCDNAFVLLLYVA